MRKVILLSLLILATPLSADPDAKDFGVPDQGQNWKPVPKGDLKRSPAQLDIQCRVTGQIARGLASVMEMATHLKGEIPPYEFMQSYITNFYNQKDRLDRIAIPLAVEAIDWIYVMQPPVDQHYSIGKAVEADCKNNWEVYNKVRAEKAAEELPKPPKINLKAETWSA